MSTNERIVVGVDGSGPGREALRWALDEAKCRGAIVEAVNVWRYPALTYLPVLAPPPTFAHDDFAADALATLNRSIDEVLAEVSEPVEIVRTVLEGAAAERLVEQARGAVMLVVGHRGTGGFHELLLGSVAHQCAGHAKCPVTIVRPVSPG